MNQLLKCLFFLVIGLSLFIITACDNTIDPHNEERGLYSIYGMLDIDKSQNYIRIRDLHSPFTDEATQEIDAEVTLQNLANGTSEVLRDTVVEFGRENSHNFLTTMNITPDTPYQLTVERSDGKEMMAMATTPPVAQVNVQPSNPRCGDVVTISFNPVNRSQDLEFLIGFDFGSAIGRVFKKYELSQEANKRLVIQKSPLEVINEIIPRRDCSSIVINKVFVKYTHYGPDFFENTFGDEILGEAGQFGGGYDRSFEIPIDSTD